MLGDAREEFLSDNCRNFAAFFLLNIFFLEIQLSQYLDVLEEALSDLSGPLWRSTFGKKSSFVVQAMGKNSVNNVAKDVASVLGLLNQNEDESGKSAFCGSWHQINSNLSSNYTWLQAETATTYLKTRTPS